MIRVESDRKNARGKPIGYDLMPFAIGTPRHNEEFTQHDLWVSQLASRSAAGVHLRQPAQHREGRGSSRAGRHRALGHSAVHHEPRDEDGKPDSAPRLWPGDDAWEGSALVMWSGFDLRPRNFFDRTPFYPYPPVTPAANPNRNLELRQETTAGAQPRD